MNLCVFAGHLIRRQRQIRHYRIRHKISRYAPAGLTINTSAPSSISRAASTMDSQELAGFHWCLYPNNFPDGLLAANRITERTIKRRSVLGRVGKNGNLRDRPHPLNESRHPRPSYPKLRHPIHSCIRTTPPSWQDLHRGIIIHIIARGIEHAIMAGGRVGSTPHP